MTELSGQGNKIELFKHYLTNTRFTRIIAKNDYLMHNTHMAMAGAQMNKDGENHHEKWFSIFVAEFMGEEQFKPYLKPIVIHTHTQIANFFVNTCENRRHLNFQSDLLWRE